MEPNTKRPVTYTVYVDDDESAEAIGRKQIAQRIRTEAQMHGEKMAHWAALLGVTRHAVYHVVAGRRNTPRIREFIENRLGKKFWT